jgi:pimeloyl-ACP methyl ester carboxylesterase
VAFSLHVPRPLRGALALVVLVALIGTTYQGVTTALERRRYPQPGRLVDVGGHQLHLYCTGTGAPVVVLEAPAAGLSATWSLVQTALTETTRVCSYDRAGLGWSEQGDGPYDPSSVPAELRALLDGAGERAPFVVAGDGLGAAFARAFALRFPDVTAAVVLLDAPDAAGNSPDRRSLGRLPAAMPWLARVGLVRLNDLGGTRGAADRPSARVLRAFMNRPDHLSRSALEMAKWDESVGLAAGPGGPGLPAAAPAALASAAPDRLLLITAPLGGRLTSERGALAATTAIRRAVEQIRTAPR